MRRAAAVVLAAGLLGACGFLTGEFRVSGTITIASHLQSRVPRQNSVLFIIATNLGGVPVAVHRVVNPQFPVSYALTDEDLIVPGGRPKESLLVEVQMNTHGNVGKPVKGDLSGRYPDPVGPTSFAVHIVIDQLVR